MHQKGFLLVIDGPSAVGKSTILEALLQQQELALEVAKRVTTRPKRKEDDTSYVFINQKEYDKMVAEDELLEHHCYLFGMCYGLPKKAIMQQLKEGKNLIGMINLGNFAKLKAQLPNSYGVFINASITTIRQRLESRGTHSIEQIEERLDNARRGQQYLKDYDLIVVNENQTVENSVNEIIQAFKHFIETTNNKKLHPNNF